MKVQQKKYQRIGLTASVMLRSLHQIQNVSGYELVKKFGKKYATRSIYRHIKKPLEDTFDKRKHNPGRPRKLTLRMERTIVRTVRLRQEVKGFSSKKVQESAVLGWGISNRDVRRCLARHGFKYCQSRKKGLLTEKDKKDRVKFARRCLKLPAEHWQKDIAFYLDGVGFAHKMDPAGEARMVSSMTWRKASEGILITTKGRKEGSGGKMANFFVAIAHGKGPVMAKHHEWKITGQNFAQHIVEESFPSTFEKCNAGSALPLSRMFLQDGCPRQNAKVVKNALESRYEVFRIPPRSPDLNPIENFFHLVRRKLRQEALAKNIRRENYAAYCCRITKTIEGMSTQTIDNIIESMPKRLKDVVKLKGNRTKY